MGLSQCESVQTRPAGCQTGAMETLLDAEDTVVDSDSATTIPEESSEEEKPCEETLIEEDETLETSVAKRRRSWV